MYEKTRVCECCGKELVYGSRSAWWLAEKNNAICKSCASKKRAKRFNNLSVLLEETPETYYWIGFLLADGHFDNGKRIVVGLAEHDRDHLEKFAKYIGYKGTISLVKKGPYSAVRLSAMDTEVVGKLCEKFDIKSNKTYNPPESLSWIPEDLFLCLMAGLIDGDGSINESCIRIKVHISWFNILLEFCKRLKLPEKNVFLTKEGYCLFYINRIDANNLFKDLICNNTIPFMHRKWLNIVVDEFKRLNYDDYCGPHKSEGTKKIISLYENGYTTKQISKIVNKKEGTVLKIKSRYINIPDLHKKEKSLKKKEEIIHLLISGKRYKEISKIVGVSLSYITKIKKEYYEKK